MRKRPAPPTISRTKLQQIAEKLSAATLSRKHHVPVSVIPTDIVRMDAADTVADVNRITAAKRNRNLNRG